MTAIRPETRQQLDKLLADLDLPALYKQYEWKGDTHEKGFPDLFRLEETISGAAKHGDIRQEHLVEIAKWGKLRNTKKISCREPLSLPLYTENGPAPGLEAEAKNLIEKVDSQVTGFGPTYASKLLHFAVPQVFGALDTRLVRVFGNAAPKYHLLNLDAVKVSDRWMISPDQDGWPGEYGTWVAILRYLADELNRTRKKCDHPDQYYRDRIREKDVWLPADVETALFSYASQVLEADRDNIEEVIGYHFRDRALLKTATTRRGFFSDIGMIDGACLEPLATLGDAVLDLAAINRLYERDTRTEEGLTEGKNRGVKRIRTRKFFDDNHLHKYITWGNGEERDRIWEKGHEAPDAVTEALIGAIFLDAEQRGWNGLQTVRKFLEDKNFFGQE